MGDLRIRSDSADQPARDQECRYQQGTGRTPSRSYEKKRTKVKKKKKKKKRKKRKKKKMI
eukprot:NODE_2141_length_391_cov_42.071970_g2131_i0.p2 GENE.NODE_2141_length_391_cov_42.071970_g2131_i0~~NODE_2141_length_391_cov_42.071970_g2131_i0.p2  ORF type:complete len:60 (-),score=20.38 NODE_2141_length_391_cov_42.071970_g2131_i0:15-194(-)